MPSCCPCVCSPVSLCFVLKPECHLSCDLPEVPRTFSPRNIFFKELKVSWKPLFSCVLSTVWRRGGIRQRLLTYKQPTVRTICFTPVHQAAVMQKTLKQRWYYINQATIQQQQTWRIKIVLMIIRKDNKTKAYSKHLEYKPSTPWLTPEINLGSLGKKISPN